MRRSTSKVKAMLSGRQRRNRQGATLVTLTLLLPVVLAVAAYAINVVYMELSRTELQITTDVSTRAAGRTLAVTSSQPQAIQAAVRLMTANPFANQKMSLNGADVVFGVSTRISENERYKFTSGKNPNATRIQANGKIQVPMLFPTMGVPVNFRPMKTAISTQLELDIALVMDRSGSMAFAANEISGGNSIPAAAPIGWQFGNAIPPKARWLDTNTAVQSFLNVLTTSSIEEQISLTTYSTTSKLDLKLTTKYGDVTKKMADYNKKYPGGWTNIGDGILTALSSLSDKKLARPWASRVMIVMTDGIHNTGTDPVVAAQQAASQNVSIYTITFSAEADIPRMQTVASVGSGKHYHAKTGQELVNAFNDIARKLPTLITY